MGTVIIKGGRLWNGQRFSENSELIYETENEKDQLLSLGEQDMILPGVIDTHIHVWTPYASRHLSVPADRIYYKGVVAAIDAGSFGADVWHQANRFLMNTTPQTVKMFMHVLPAGLTGFPLRNKTQVENVDFDRVIEAAKADRTGNLMGFKIHLGQMDLNHDVKLLKAARKCADAVGKHVAIHVSGAKAPFETIAEYLKPGDMIAHAFSGIGDPILDQNGHVKECVKEAAAKGVRLDVAYATRHFSWRVFREARDEGILFDFVGTDSTAKNYENPEYGLYDIFHIASGLMNSGVPEEHVIRALTTNPAEYTGYTLDLTKQVMVLKRENRIVPYYDDTSQGLDSYIIGDHEYVPVFFMDRGRIMFEKKW